MKLKNTKNYKVEIAVGISVIFILAAFSGMSLTRTITDSSDTIETYIRNSNGNYWEATSANLENAIIAGNHTGVVLTLPVGDFEISNDVSFANLTLVGQGCGSFSGSSDFDVTSIHLIGNNTITMGAGGVMRDVKIYCPSGAGGGVYHNTNAVKVIGDSTWSGDYWMQPEILKNVLIHKVGSGTNGTALNLTGMSNSGDGSGKIALSTFDKVSIFGFKYGLYIYAEDNGVNSGYVNGNVFNDFMLHNVRNGITIKQGGSGSAERNIFNNIVIQTSNNNEVCIRLDGADDNEFKSVKLFDIGVSGGQAINLTSGCYGNSFEIGSSITVEYTNFDAALYNNANTLDIVSKGLNNAYSNTIYLPSGENNLTASFGLASKTKYIGAGIGSTILNLDGNQIGMTNDNNITFSDLTIKTNGHTQALRLDGVLDNITIKNVHFIGGTTYGGIHLEDNSEISNLIITDCIFSEASRAMRFRPGITFENCIITNNIISDMSTEQITFDEVYTSGIIIKDNIGYDNSTYEYIPCGSGSDFYSSPSDGAMYFESSNQTLAVYWDSSWYYYLPG